MTMDNPFAPEYREPESDDAPSTITLGNGNTVAGTPSEYITYHKDLIQGSDEWLAAALRVLTASEMKHILTPTLKTADNDKTRAHEWELLGQRITGLSSRVTCQDDMLRGRDDEIEARRLQYAKHHAPVEEVGFITNVQWGFTIGYSARRSCRRRWPDRVQVAPAEIPDRDDSEQRGARRNTSSSFRPGF
jgi:hypothetical protein